MIVQDTKANLTTWNPLKDLIIRVCVLNSAGCGPWSDFFLLEAQEVMGEYLLLSLDFGGKKSEVLGLLFFSDSSAFSAYNCLSHVALYNSMLDQAE